MIEPKNLLIIGAGYLGKTIAKIATANGWTVTAARRSEPTADEMALCAWLKLDVHEPDDIKTKLQDSLKRFSAIVYAVSAGAPDADAYELAYYNGVKNILQFLEPNSRFLFVSSTGVYCEDRGEHVNEQTLVSAGSLSQSQRHIVRGEHLVLSRSNSIITRLSGIYGPGRNRLITMAKSLPDGITVNQLDYTNRIHVEDGARAIVHLLELPHPEAIYCVTDHEPVPQHEVLLYLRKQLGLAPPEIFFANQGVNDAELEALPSRNKRISNNLLVNTGFKFLYPTYREGYRSLLQG